MKEKAIYTLAVALLADLTFLILHHFYLSNLLGEGFSIESDKGYAERFQHLKELGVCIMIAALWLKKRDYIYIVWATIFTYMFFDDAFRIHETVGRVLSESLHFIPVANLRAKDIGEILVHAVAGSCFIVALAVGYRYSATEARRASAVLLILLAAFAAFGGLVDVVHAASNQYWWSYRIGIIEEGGEMMVMSIILSFVIYKLMRTTIATSAQDGIPFSPSFASGWNHAESLCLTASSSHYQTENPL